MKVQKGQKVKTVHLSKVTLRLNSTPFVCWLLLNFLPSFTVNKKTKD